MMIWSTITKITAVSALGLALQTQPEAPSDVWKPFRFFVGAWAGSGEGKPGRSQGEQQFEFVLGGKYLQVRNETRFDSQPQNPNGETHEDMGLFSYDRGRKKYVLRQFHIEGFVNQYISDGAAEGGKTFVFESEAIENIPPGWKARLTYTILNPDSFEQTFELAAPGKAMECYSKGVMMRKTGH